MTTPVGSVVFGFHFGRILCGVEATSLLRYKAVGCASVLGFLLKSCSKTYGSSSWTVHKSKVPTFTGMSCGGFGGPIRHIFWHVLLV